eukprot:s1157_g12.t1
MAVARVATMRALALRLRPSRLALGRQLWPTLARSGCRGLNGLTGLPGAKTILEENVADSVFMVKPTGFTSNLETMQEQPGGARMEGEWQSLVSALEAAGVEVLTAEAQGLPDPGRSLECTQSRCRKFGLVEPIYDMTPWAKSCVALEGTGSLVLDRHKKTAYLATSKRIPLRIHILPALVQELGYDLVCFSSRDRHGQEIYHTNVLMSVNSNFAVICPAAIPDPQELKTVYDALKRSNKVVVNVTMEQLEPCLIENFACNCLQLRGSKGSVLAISDAGWRSLDDSQRGVLESCVDQVVSAHVPTLERIGGGSVRCMVAELFKRRGQESEHGRLELVIVHEPGLEVDAVMPWTLDTMKVDECFNRVHLKAQHRDFTSLLKGRGAQVVHVRDLLIEVREEVRRDLFESVWGKEFVDGHNLANLQVDQLITGFSRESLQFEQPPLMNLFFMRDPIFSVPGGWVVIARPFFPIRYQESRLLRAIFRLHPSLKDVKVYEGLVDDPEVTIEGRDTSAKRRWIYAL